MLPLIYLITLTRNENGLWLAVFGDIVGQPADDLQAALANLARLLELHRELADLLLSEDTFQRLTKGSQP
jgi:hypothetical protein